MNRINKTFLATLAGVETTFYLFTPILLCALWVKVNGLDSISSYLLYGIGLLATLFRAIKIGWMR